MATNFKNDISNNSGKRPNVAPSGAKTPAPSGGCEEWPAFAVRFGIDDDHLSARREFLRLAEKEAALLAEMLPWARSEAAQIRYFTESFEGAASNWNLAHFEKRLFVGWLPDKIDLPYKWYTGSYCELPHLLADHLRKSVEEREKETRPMKISNASSQRNSP